MHIKFKFTFLCILCLLSISLFAAADGAGIMQITKNPAYQGRPSVYENYVVWQDGRNGDADIYLYDISTGEEKQISNSSTHDEFPRIYGIYVVWMGYVPPYRSRIWQIYLYDITNGETRHVSPTSKHQTYPAIYENKVYWNDFRNSNQDIFMYDLDTEQEWQITSNAIDQQGASIFEDDLIWWDRANGLIYYDTSAHSEIPIDNSPAADYYQYMNCGELGCSDYFGGEYVYWKSAPSGFHAADDVEIYSYKPIEEKEVQITFNSFRDFEPVIHGENIVWTANKDGNDDIFLYNASSPPPLIKINSAIATDAVPRIHGNRVVWHSRTTAEVSSGYISMYDLTTGEDRPISEEGQRVGFADIYEDLVVWDVSKFKDADGITHYDWNIVLYNVTSGTSTLITTDPQTQVSPKIHGNFIVWRDNRHGGWEIYLYDLTKKEEKRITFDRNNKGNPVVDDGLVVYLSNSSGTWQVHLYDTSLGLSRIITSGATGHGRPIISGNKITYQKPNDWRIYLYDLGSKQEKAITPAANGYYDYAFYGDNIAWVPSGETRDPYVRGIPSGIESLIFPLPPSHYASPTDIYENKAVLFVSDMRSNDVYLYDFSNVDFSVPSPSPEPSPSPTASVVANATPSPSSSISPSADPSTPTASGSPPAIPTPSFVSPTPSGSAPTPSIKTPSPKGGLEEIILAIEPFLADVIRPPASRTPEERAAKQAFSWYWALAVALMIFAAAAYYVYSLKKKEEENEEIEIEVEDEEKKTTSESIMSLLKGEEKRKE